MQQLGHLHKILTTLSRKTTVCGLHYSPPAAQSIIKFKGLPFTSDQAALSATLSNLTIVASRYQQTILGGQMLSQCPSGTEELVQGILIQDESVAFCPIRTLQLSHFLAVGRPWWAQADSDEHCSEAGNTSTKSNQAIKAGVWTKCCFSCAWRGSCTRTLVPVFVIWGKKMHYNPMRCTHAEYLV